MARIEAALARIEVAAARPAPAPQVPDDSALRTEIGEALRDLDRLIGALEP